MKGREGAEKCAWCAVRDWVAVVCPTRRGEGEGGM